MLAATPGAQAGPVTITIFSDGDLPSPISDMVTVVDANGNNVVPPLTLTEADEANGVTYFIGIRGVNWNLPNTLFLLEPSGATSDILTLLNRGNTAFIYFTSDDDRGNLGNIPIINPQFTFTEGANGITVFGNFSLNTPEPSTFALAGLGALGLAGYGWRKRRRAVA
jgi:hypothetical protein